MGMKEHADDLARRRAHAARMGGDEAVARQHAAGKLTVRERIDRLFDKDTFTEIGIHATHAGIAPDLAGRETPADGVVTGFGKIDGRLASLIAYDFTVMAGSMGRNAETSAPREIAYTKRIPMIWLIDSAGARIQEALISPYIAAGAALIDDVIDPRDTRPTLVRALEMADASVSIGPGASTASCRCRRRPGPRDRFHRRHRRRPAADDRRAAGAELSPALGLRPRRQHRPLGRPRDDGLARAADDGLALHGRPRRLRPLGAR